MIQNEKRSKKNLKLFLFDSGLLALLGLSVIYKVFHGPSRSARNALTMTLLEPSATKWIPYVFLGKETVEQIRNEGKRNLRYTTDTEIPITFPDNTKDCDEWISCPDGIRIEEYKGKTYNAHIMLVRDPSRLYLGLSSYSGFRESVPGKRLHLAIEEEKASAAVNAGAFNDDGTGEAYVGSVPAGLTIHGGKVVSDVNREMVPEQGFCGFNKDYKLIVASEMSAAEATRQNITEGCEFGPVLICNGEINQDAYAGHSGYNPRTAIGQRPDGTVILVCADGRQAGSIGATYKDLIDIMTGYGAVDACNLDGGSSTVMFYRDECGKYGEAGNVKMINSYSVMQSIPRRMPTFWMVKPLIEGG